MTRTLSVHALRGLALLALFASGQALAARDHIYPSAAGATVNGINAPLTASFSPPGNGSAGAGHVTLTQSVVAGQAVVVTATWSVHDRSLLQNTNTVTGYAQTVSFAVTQPMGQTLSVAAIANCTLNSNAGTCTTPVSFSPTVAGSYMLSVIASGGPGNSTVEGGDDRKLNINLSVIEVQAKADTTLTVGRQCIVLGVGNVDLTSTLRKAPDDSAVAGASIDYYLEPESFDGVPTTPPLGSATTNTSGLASLAYNPSGLGVGDYTIYGEFGGNATLNPSNDSATLGVSYRFDGFRPPINALGNSIFGGRVIPVKIKLADAAGNVVTDAQPLVWIVSYNVTNMGEDVEAATSVSSADTGNIMRYDASEQQYIYNLDVTDLANGTYKIRVDLGDSPTCGSDYEVPITIARKGKK